MNRSPLKPSTNPQHMDALAKGVRVRVERAALKRDLKAARRTLAEALASECVKSMTIEALLLYLPRVGYHKAEIKLRKARVSPTRIVGALTERERSALCEAVRG